MSSREAILTAVRSNQPAPGIALPQVPNFAKASHSLLNDFRDALIRMGGKFAEVETGAALDGLIGALFPQAKVICSATSEVASTRSLSASTDPADLADVDLAIVRAAFGVAETGSIWLSEQELQVNALAYLAQHLVVLLDPNDIVGNLHDAYRDPRFRTARYAVLVTGPSATADIEGVLIHGAQGVRSLTVAIVPLNRGRQAS
jgi:L-lactate dehydrogenase complex protein LldG